MTAGFAALPQDRHDFKWATVTSVAPLAVRLDGEASPLNLTPDSLVPVASLTIGDRVWCQKNHHRVLVLGIGGGSGAAGAEIGGSVAAGTYYEKYPDGRLICAGSWEESDDGGHMFDWAPAKAFVGREPHVTLNLETWWPNTPGISAGTSRPTGSAIRLWCSNQSGFRFKLYAQAEGRWK